VSRGAWSLALILSRGLPRKHGRAGQAQRLPPVPVPPEGEIGRMAAGQKLHTPPATGGMAREVERLPAFKSRGRQPLAPKTSTHRVGGLWSQVPDLGLSSQEPAPTAPDASEATNAVWSFAVRPWRRRNRVDRWST
jgi:hypothetical protein